MTGASAKIESAAASTSAVTHVNFLEAPFSSVFTSNAQIFGTKPIEKSGAAGAAQTHNIIIIAKVGFTVNSYPIWTNKIGGIHRSAALISCKKRIADAAQIWYLKATESRVSPMYQ